MNAEDCAGGDAFARYKRASNVLSGLRADLAALRVSPYGRDQQAAIKLTWLRRATHRSSWKPRFWPTRGHAGLMIPPYRC
jgi:hypothetical protein